MKKYFEIISLTIFVLIMLHFLSCSASVKSNNLENKNGNFRKIEAYKFNFKNDSIPKSMIHLQTKYFDSAGLLTKEIKYDTIGAHSWIKVNPKTEPRPESHDIVTRRIEKIQSEMLPSLKELFHDKKLDTVKTKIYESDEYKYDINSRIIGRVYCREDTFHLHSTWKYNSFGDLIEENHKYHDSLMNFKRMYFYDENRILIKKKLLNDVDLLRREEIYNYNVKNQLIKMIANVPPVNRASITNYEYDSVGNLVKYSTYESNDSSYSWISYKYDDKNRKTDIFDNYSFHNVFVYDEIGNIIEESNYYGDEDIVWMYLFIYDDYQNMIEQYVYEQDHSISVILYTYEYY